MADKFLGLCSYKFGAYNLNGTSKMKKKIFFNIGIHIEITFSKTNVIIIN